MRRLRTALLATGALTTASAVTATWLSACGSTTCEEDKTCSPATGDDASHDATNSDVGPDVAPPGCDLSKEPKDAPDCVVNAVGAFVSSSSGSDTSGDGTKEKPFASIGKALSALTGTAKRRVYICDGSYAETVTIDHALDGAGLYGGFTCAAGAWNYSGVKPVIAPAAGGAVPLTIGGLTTGATIADLKLVAPDGQKPGESSIATFVHDSSGIAFTRASLVAGSGAPGADGTTTEAYPGDAGRADGGGSPLSGAPQFGAQPAVCVCATEQTIGGAGGLGNAAAPGPGQPGQPDRGAGDAGTASTGGCANGGRGGDGPAGTGGNGAPIVGTISAAGWNGTTGANGTPGHVAQGGGGGGGGPADGTGGGGSGGCGGCGGGAGSGGRAGGASIAFLAFHTSATCLDSEFTAGDGGEGGQGAAAQAGQLGGFGGIQSAPGCPGGTGGTGGSGGGGGGGAGGISIAIAFSGEEPHVTGGTQTVSSKVATGGAAGSPGGTKGADGISEKAHAF